MKGLNRRTKTLSKKFGEWRGRQAQYSDFGRRRQFHTTLKLLKNGYAYTFDTKAVVEYPPTLPDRLNLHFKPNDQFELDLWVNRVTGEFMYLVVGLSNGTLSSNITQKGDRHVKIEWLPKSIWVEGKLRFGTNYKRVQPVKFRLVIIMKNPRQILEQPVKSAQRKLM